MSDLVIRPDEAERCCNLLMGSRPAAPTLPPARGIGVRRALEQAVLPALRQPPCLVSFSGGRDSSAVLAAATDVARRHGLDDPVPVTMRFPGAPASDETAWQERVITHLGLGDHVVVRLGDELDALGETATDVLQRLGPHWPANAYMHVPLLAHAVGGSLLTGAGGDELFASRGGRLVLVTRRRARPSVGDLREAGRSVLPRRLRVRLRQRSNPVHLPWLTADGVAVVSAAMARETESWPPRWDRSVQHWYQGRAFGAIAAAVPLVAAPIGVLVINPFLEPGVLAELALLGGPCGFASRDEAMRRLFGDLLPADVLTRSTKAVFDGAIWGPAVREFASAWQGDGVDERLVDVGELRRQWGSGESDFRTMLLLQAAWLASA